MLTVLRQVLNWFTCTKILLSVIIFHVFQAFYLIYQSVRFVIFNNFTDYRYVYRTENTLDV